MNIIVRLFPKPVFLFMSTMVRRVGRCISLRKRQNRTLKKITIWKILAILFGKHDYIFCIAPFAVKSFPNSDQSIRPIMVIFSTMISASGDKVPAVTAQPYPGVMHSPCPSAVALHPQGIQTRSTSFLWPNSIQAAGSVSLCSVVCWLHCRVNVGFPA